MFSARHNNYIIDETINKTLIQYLGFHPKHHFAGCVMSQVLSDAKDEEQKAYSHMSEAKKWIKIASEKVSRVVLV